jgi:hypothetical protein
MLPLLLSPGINLLPFTAQKCNMKIDEVKKFKGMLLGHTYISI